MKDDEEHSNFDFTETEWTVCLIEFSFLASYIVYNRHMSFVDLN